MKKRMLNILYKLLIYKNFNLYDEHFMIKTDSETKRLDVSISRR